MISISGPVTIVVELIVAGIIFYLLWWALGRTAPPEPFRKVAEVILILLAVLVVVGILLTAVGGQPLFRP